VATATLYSKGCPCSCNRRIENKPCTDCCPISLGTKSFSEAHGSDECPNVGEPCPSGPDPGSPSCSGRTIGPINLRSDPFPTECLKNLKPVAAVSLAADNFGMASGESGQVGCLPTNACTTCDQSGTVTPYVESAGNGKSRLRITAKGQNSVHGGPYALFVTATFSLQPI
jgi:hypothetical protein